MKWRKPGISVNLPLCGASFSLEYEIFSLRFRLEIVHFYISLPSKYGCHSPNALQTLTVILNYFYLSR